MQQLCLHISEDALCIIRFERYLNYMDGIYGFEHRIRIVTGHYGSGKTEFSLNLAVRLKKQYDNVAIADLDVINLYFRSREKEDELKKLGIRIFSSSVKATAVDIPAVSADIMTPIEDNNCQLIMDVGGNPAGTRTLGRYRNFLKNIGFQHLFILNANRPETNTCEKAVDFINGIRAQSGLDITGIVNTTHMLKATTVDDLLKGQQLCREVSKTLDLPILYTAAMEEVAKQLPENMDGEIIPLKLFMREGWMM
jgi:hypothetical protein